VQRSGLSVELVVGSGSAPSSAPRAHERGADGESARALRGLQRGLDLVVSPRADATLAACRHQLRDLVVLEGPLSESDFRLLERLRHTGPPVVVVGPESEARSLEALRRGAADCVDRGPDFGEVLPEVALEHIRRWRRQRERSHSERRLAWVERLYTTVASELPLGVLVLDERGTVIDANPTARALVGEATLALPVASWLSTGDGRPCASARALASGERTRDEAALLCRADGTRSPVRVSCAPWAVEAGVAVDGGPPGPLRGATLVLQDATELEDLQRQVLQSEKMASVGQLAAGVAHEINNPVGFVHANLAQLGEYLHDLKQVFERVDALQKAVAGGDPSQVDDASQELERASQEVDLDFVLRDFESALRESREGAERIRMIVSDLREFSHQGRAELEWADLNRCLDTTANIAWTMMKHSVRLEKDYGDLPSIRCNAGQLQQVFLNLLVNAHQAIEEKQGRGGALGTIRLATRPVEGGVVIGIEDTGQGIAPDHVSRIFDPFFTTKEVGVGTGLGLSTVYRIVEDHGGRVAATSTPGEGSRFEVWLPVDGGGETS